MLSFDLSWLAPLLIFVGVVLFLTRQAEPIGRFGRVLIGLGLIIFALQWIAVAAKPVVQAAGVKVIFASLTGDLLLDMLVAAVLTVLCYSSLAVVLLVATLASLHVIGLPVALGLVLGANLGSGVLGMLSTLQSPPEARRVTLGNFLFKLIGFVVLGPLVHAPAGADRGAGPGSAPARSFCSISRSTSRWPSIFLFFTAPIARDRRAPAPGEARDRRRGEAPAPRSVGARHAGARDLLRGPRGAAHRRRDRADAERHADRAEDERPGARRAAAQDGRHRRRALHGGQALPDADLARGARGEAKAGAGPTSSRSRSTWSRSATSSSASSPTSWTRRSTRAATSPRPDSPRSATCTRG